MKEMLEAALRYAERGWSVFPLRPRSKAPACRHGFYDATTDAARIERWWRRRPHDNVGIATGETSDLSDPKKVDAKALRDAIGKADLVVIDTLARATPTADENASDAMKFFVDVLDRLKMHLGGCAVVIVHHVGKDASRGPRGHSSLIAAVDTAIMVEKRSREIRVACVTKQRDMAAGEDIAFRLDIVELGVDEDGDPVTSCVVYATDEVAPAKTPTGQAKAALDVLNQLVAEKGELFEWGYRGVSEEAWREAMSRSGMFGDGANFRNAWKRARKKLGDDGHVGFGEGRVWSASASPSTSALITT